MFSELLWGVRVLGGETGGLLLAAHGPLTAQGGR